MHTITGKTWAQPYHRPTIPSETTLHGWTCRNSPAAEKPPGLGSYSPKPCPSGPWQPFGMRDPYQNGTTLLLGLELGVPHATHPHFRAGPTSR